MNRRDRRPFAATVPAAAEPARRMADLEAQTVPSAV